MCCVNGIVWFHVFDMSFGIERGCSSTRRTGNPKWGMPSILQRNILATMLRTTEVNTHSQMDQDSWRLGTKAFEDLKMFSIGF